MKDTAVEDVELVSRRWQDFQEPISKNVQFRVPTAEALVALNGATKSSAAQVYTEVGWRIAPMWQADFHRADPGYCFTSILWKRRRAPSLGIETGLVSGIVGLKIRDLQSLAILEDKFGPVPYPRIKGKDIVICFRAPKEQYTSRNISPGYRYIGENDCLRVPTSNSNKVRLEWQVGQMDLSLVLPKLPRWLHSILSKQ